MKNNYRSKILTMLLVLSLLILPVTSFAQSELIVDSRSFDNMGSITSMKLGESNNSFMKSNHSAPPAIHLILLVIVVPI